MTDIFKGSTTQTIFIELVDATTGLPKTGIVYTDVTGSYARTRSARVAITMATLASVSAAHASGGFILVDDTNQPGVYRVDVPDAAFASGAAEVVCTFNATGCRTVSRSINLVNINNQVAYVPNAAADAAGGLVISDAGGLDIDARLDAAVSSRNATTPPTVSAIADEVQTRTIARVTLVDTTTTNTDMRGTNNAALATGVTLATSQPNYAPAKAGDQMALTPTAQGLVAAACDLAIINQGDGADLITLMANAIAADWVAGDASPLAIADAVWTRGTRTITGGALTAAPPTAAEILTALGTGSWATSLATQASVDDLPTNGELATALSGISGGGGGGGGSSGGGNTVERSVTDTNPITFSWLRTGATITARVSINNADYIDTAGTVTFLRTEGEFHLYTLSFDADDRPTAEGVARYEWTEVGYDPEYLTLAVQTAVLDSASQSWTTEQVEFALEKLTLLGVVADAVVVPAGAFLCGRGDIEQIFGTVAVSRWGDLNNNEDADEITARINYRISIADNYMRSTLGNGAWVMPLEGEDIPPILAYYTACLAGVLLYEGRGVQDYDARGFAQHQLSFHKKGVEDFVKGVLFGAISLTPLVSNVTSAAPEAS